MPQNFCPTDDRCQDSLISDSFNDHITHVVWNVYFHVCICIVWSVTCCISKEKRFYVDTSQMEQPFVIQASFDDGGSHLRADKSDISVIDIILNQGNRRSIKLSDNWLVFWQIKTDLPECLINTHGFPRLIGRTHRDLSRPIALALRQLTKIRFTSRLSGLAHSFQGHHSWYTKQRTIKKVNRNLGMRS